MGVFDGKQFFALLQVGIFFSVCENTAALHPLRQIRQPDISAVMDDAADALFVHGNEAFCHGRPGDTLIALSTSGNSENILRAVQASKALGLHTVGFTGQSGGRLAACCDVCIRVPETETFRVQELHLPVYHTLCLMLEDAFFDGERK